MSPNMFSYSPMFSERRKRLTRFGRRLRINYRDDNDDDDDGHESTPPRLRSRTPTTSILSTTTTTTTTSERIEIAEKWYRGLVSRWHLPSPTPATAKIYAPLPSPTCIRILELLPASSEKDTIKCQLSTVSLDSAPQYEALSYVWGAPADKETIVCESVKIKVPRNLHDVLRRVRDPVRLKRLWADAVCINQADAVEVGLQVRQMDRVYAEAERVLVWLGLDDPFENFTGVGEKENRWELIQRFCLGMIPSCTDDDHDDSVERGEKKKEEKTKTAPPPLNDPIFSTSGLEDPELAAFFSAFGDFFLLPWFDRLWVVQEAGLAKSAILLFGNHGQEIDFDHLIPLVQRLGDAHPGLILEYGIFYGVEVFSYFGRRKHIRDASVIEDVDFLEMVERTRGHLASDLRDFVFALLGHGSARRTNINNDGRGRGPLIINPDYQKSHWQIYHELAATLLEQSDDLRVLAAVKHLDDENLSREFPSWVPTWARSLFADSVGVLRDDCKYRRAHGGIPRSLQFINKTPGEDGSSNNSKHNILRIRGFAFDTIHEFPKASSIPIQDSAPSSWSTASESHMDEPVDPDDFWPISTALSIHALHSLPPEAALYELMTALTCAWPDSHWSAQPGCKDFAAFRLHLPELQGKSSESAVLPEGRGVAEKTAQGGMWQSFVAQAKMMVEGRRVFSTKENGLVGLGPSALRTGDVCCILFGGDVPFILRPVVDESGNEKGYRLVGKAYIRKVMQGELVTDHLSGENKYEERDFDIF